MVEFFGKNRRRRSLCGNHQQPLNFFCEKCMVPICRDCTVLEHKERDGHNYLDIKDAFHRFEETLKTQVDATQEMEKRYASRENSLKQQLQELSDTQINSEETLDNFFDECVRQIEERRAKLREELNGVVENERTNLQENLEVVAAKREMLNDKASALDAGISCGNLHEAFSIHKELQDHAAALQVESEKEDANRVVKFSPVHQDDFNTILQTLGRVIQPAPAGWVRAVDSPPPADRISVGTNTTYRSVSTRVDFMDQSVSTMTFSSD